jgi:WD40 repeat protein/serine/threonine protein kinase
MSVPDSSRDLRLERLAEEFVERHRRGECPPLSDYTERYPELAADIRELFPALVRLEHLKPVAGDLSGPFVGPVMDTARGQPERLGDYRIVREIGRGGMGVVYEAEQVSLGRHVALKVLPGQGLLEAKYLLRFQREARAAARLHHTNIVPVFGVGEQDGVHYYVMQFIPGLGLDAVLTELRRLRQARPTDGEEQAIAGPQAEQVSAVAVAQLLLTGQFHAGDPTTSGAQQDLNNSPNQRANNPPTPASSVHLPGQAEGSSLSGTGRPYWKSVARVGVQVAEALAYANNQGILHRDIKPSNLLLDTHGTVWVTDFGLAKAADSADLTHTGDIVGTLRYLAPERFQGQADARGDVYALGLTLYELLRLRPAFDETDRNKLVAQVMHDTPPRPCQLNAAVPRDLETIVLKAMERDLGRRYQTAADLAADLQRFVDDRPIQARRLGQVERFWRWCRRNPGLASLTAAVATLLFVVAVGATFAALQSRRHSQQLESNLYFQSIALAHRVLTANIPIPAKAEALLDACPEHLRGWEWDYLKRLWRIEPVVLRDPAHAKVNSVAFSPDGTHLAAGCGDGTVKVWDLTTGQVVLLQGHDQYVFSVAFSPTDGRRLASGSIDKTVKIWDLTKGTAILTLPGAEGGEFGMAYGVAFSPDGRWLATGSEGEDVRIWDATTGQKIHSLPGHAHQATNMTFRGDGRLLATGDQVGTVQVWDAVTGQRLRTLQRPEVGAPVGALAFSPDGRRLAVGYFNRLVAIWDPTTGELVRTLAGHTGLVLGLAFSPDGRRLATTGGDDKLVRLWELSNYQEVLELRGHTDFCQCLAFSPDGRRLASVSMDQTIRLWDATPLSRDESQAGLTFREHTQEIWCVAVSPDGRLIASGGLDGTVRVWDWRSGQSRTVDSHSNTVFSVAFSPDGRRLAGACQDRGGPIVVKVWDATTGQEAFRVPDSNPYFVVAFSPDGHWLVTAGDKGTIKAWDTITGQEVRTLGRHERQIFWGVSFRPDGRRLASGSMDGTVKVWDATPGQEMLPARPQWLLLLGLGPQAGLSAHLPWVAGWHVHFASWCDRHWPQPLLTLHGSGAGLLAVAFGPDGQRLVTGSNDGQLTLWDAATGRPKQIVQGHAREQIVLVAFSPDNRWVASAGTDDGIVKVWDATTMAPVHTFRGHLNGIHGLAFSPDGTFLVSASKDHTVKVWDLTFLERKRPP